MVGVAVGCALCAGRVASLARSAVGKPQASSCIRHALAFPGQPALAFGLGFFRAAALCLCVAAAAVLFLGERRVGRGQAAGQEQAQGVAVGRGGHGGNDVGWWCAMLPCLLPWQGPRNPVAVLFFEIFI